MALFAQLARACAPQVASGTLAAIAATESRLDPFAIRDNTTHSAWWPRDRRRAVVLARRLIRAGHSVDLGLMQVNSGNLGRLNLTVSQAFDPCSSVHAAAALLAADYDGGKTPAAQQAALRVALSRYNTGSTAAGFANGYVARVVAAARQVVPEIDLQPTMAAKSAAPAKPSMHSWKILSSPGPSVAKGTSSGSSWNVFPQSVGPGRLAERRPVALTGRLLSPAGRSTRGSHDR